MNLPRRYIYIFRSSKGAQVTVVRGEGPPKITGGSGGWNVVNRPRRTSLTQWGGREPYRMDVPILFDGWRARVSVEEDIRRLQQMSMGHDYDPPPTITLQGALPVNGATWVIEDIDWGDEVYWSQQSSQGRFFRMRQDAVVHLLQYQAEERLKIVMPRQLPNQYTVFKEGETLRSIAKVMYGDGDKWKVIKKANPSVRDPNKLKVKTVLRIP